MPEIAEVETIKNDLLASNILGQKIKTVEFLFLPLIEISPENFIKKIRNLFLLKILRKGKYLIFDFGKIYLLIHLKMTGHLFLKRYDYKSQRHDLIIFTFENKIKLVFFDPRRFGKIYIKNDLTIVDRLGPDILSEEFVLEEFYESLILRKKKIKTLLLDQYFIAGIGNIYADEILFEAKIHPEKIAQDINKKKAKDLYFAIERVIQKAIKNRGTSLGKTKLNFTSIKEDFGFNQNHLLVHTKKICPICSALIKKIKINQRTTYFCEKCQRF
jgi:formamidopyrimidine-DNA glycosylase